ncbi:MAG: phytoene desaturase [Alphaproteobacteria bacterium]|nr:phytoene desaturase [Alphaproteobacteria bacterium]
MRPSSLPVVVIGAGMGGLACALDLAAQGAPVVTLEAAAAPGGKMHETRIGDAAIDSGPTVLTMRWVFDALFADAGATLDAHVRLTPLAILARHAWRAGEQLDLHADVRRSEDAIGAFAGAAAARGFRGFCAEARRVHDVLEGAFLTAPKPNPVTLAGRIGLHRMHDLFAIRPFETLWGALGRHFEDVRLRQLFGRYATYCGASPLQAPATLMLIADVEQRGVWAVDGGMQRLAEAMAARVVALGGDIRCGAEVAEIEIAGGAATAVRLRSGERIAARAVVCNADPNALACGGFGRAASRAIRATPMQARSLSAFTLAMTARRADFPLTRHTVFFSRDYPREFADIAAGRAPSEPTVYVCAQDRGDDAAAPPSERLFFIVNAPPSGDRGALTDAEASECESAIKTKLEACGVHLDWGGAEMRRTTPAMFHRRFAHTGGALYGRAPHGWAGTFLRPGTRTAIANLYLAGGATHPGAGVPMAALSGRLAAAAALRDLASTRRSSAAATPGGMSTRRAMTDASA